MFLGYAEGAVLARQGISARRAGGSILEALGGPAHHPLNVKQIRVLINLLTVFARLESRGRLMWKESWV